MADTFIPIPIDTIEEAAEQPTRTYRLDLDAGRIVGMVDGLEAVNQAIKKAIITPRFECLIYDNQYGSEVESEYLDKTVSHDYLEATCEGFIRDCLKPDTRILNMYDFAFEFKDEKAHVYFKADTIFGKTEISEDL